MNDVLKQHRNMAREISGVDRILRRFGGMDQGVRNANSLALRAARIAGTANFMGANRASLHAELARRAVPESLRRGPGLPGLVRSFASMGYYPPHPQSSVLMLRKMLGPILPSSHVARAFEAHGIASSYSADWMLRIVSPFRTPAMQSFLSSSTTLGPIVISPDDEDVPFDYQPDLQGWLIPQTATVSGETIDVDELRAQMVAIFRSVAQGPRTKALVRGVGKHGTTFLVAVTSEVAALAIWYCLTHL